MSTAYLKLHGAIAGLGLPQEIEAEYQTVPRAGRFASWTGDDGCAVVLGLGERRTVDFLFDGNGAFDRIRYSEEVPVLAEPDRARVKPTELMDRAGSEGTILSTWSEMDCDNGYWAEVAFDDGAIETLPLDVLERVSLPNNHPHDQISSSYTCNGSPKGCEAGRFGHCGYHDQLPETD